MAAGIFVGLTESQIVAIRTQAVALVTEGKTIMNWSSGNTSTGKQMVLPTKEVLEECRYALRKGWPATYGYLVQKATCNFNSIPH